LVGRSIVRAWQPAETKFELSTASQVSSQGEAVKSAKEAAKAAAGDQKEAAKVRAEAEVKELLALKEKLSVSGFVFFWGGDKGGSDRPADRGY
jgi:hypothetical protein